MITELHLVTNKKSTTDDQQKEKKNLQLFLQN